MQYKLGAPELEVILTLVRSGTLAEAGSRLGVDTSTVFRTIQRIEKGLGHTLFVRSRSGYRPTELAQQLAQHGERIEAELEQSRIALQTQRTAVTGTVKVTTTDTILHGLIFPAFTQLGLLHPFLQFEIHTGNEIANLTKRDADIAIRATKSPPHYLQSKHLGPIRVAIYTSSLHPTREIQMANVGDAPWIAPDDALPEHPSVVWRARHLPKVVPKYKVNSIQSVMEAVHTGLGVGIIPLFLAARHPSLLQLSEPLDECETQLWLLTHPDFRTFRRVATVFDYLADTITLNDGQNERIIRHSNKQRRQPD
jgi:DNA-binding transcriptional LysR family regulator